MINTSGVLAADVFHISFDWSVFFSQLFGFAVIIFVFVRWILPPLKRMMAKSQDAVARQLEESGKAAARLDEAKRAYDNALADAQAELDRLRSDARADADHIIVQMHEAANTEVERVRKQGRDQIAQLHRQLVRDLKAELVTNMLDRTEDRVRQQVASLQAKADSVEKFLEDLEVMANAHAAPSVKRRAQSRWN
jgi:F-type H+-transporting ATPase subunit delta